VQLTVGVIASREEQPREPPPAAEWARLESDITPRRAAVAERSSREGWIGESKQASAARVDGEVR
jgi:hypothetical protein